MEYKITKIETLEKSFNDMEGTQWRFFAHCRIYTDSTHKRFWRRAFVFMFDYEDIAEYYSSEDSDEYPTITDKMIKEYKHECAYNMAESYIGYSNDIESITNDCNATIDRWNERVRSRSSFSWPWM